MDTITQEQIERIKREAIREFQSRGGKTKSNKKRVTALANLGKVDPAKRLAASNAAQAARRERERAERNQVVCPQCGEVARAQKKVMSDAAPDLLAALEKMLRYSSMPDDGTEQDAAMLEAQAAVRKARGL